MERYARLVPENAEVDLFERMDDLKKYEAGEDVPQIPREQWSPGNPSRHDYEPACDYYELAVISAHLGMGLRRDSNSDLRRVTELASEIYFGHWWQTYRKSRKYDRYPTPAHEIRSRFFEFWLTGYCYGVLCALVLKDDWTAGRLGCYPGPDVVTDDGERGLRRPDMLFHVVLGNFLRYGDMELVLPEWTSAISQGRSARAKLWLKALRAIDKGKRDAFTEVFYEIAEHHRKNEYSPRLKGAGNYGALKLVMQEGSILWHLARRKGVAPPWEDLPIEVSDHLLTSESITGKA